MPKVPRQDMANIGSYEQMVIDNLRIAGVQNTRREEQLKFDSLEPFAGVWLHAAGLNSDERRVAVSIGYDLLLICGFAFDAVASEEIKRYGNLNVQIVRMNLRPDDGQRP